MAVAEGKYIYGAIASREARNFGPIGVGDRNDLVYTINYRDLAMVVSDSPIIIYDPDRKHALQHERVLGEIMKEFTVIPASFGLIFKSEADVQELLKKIYEEAMEALKNLDNKVELGLKVLWKKEYFAAEIEKGFPQLRQLKAAAARESPKYRKQVFSKKFQLGQMIENIVAQKRSRYIGEIYYGLQRYAVASVANDLITNRMILNAAFLVDKNREQEFDAQVSRFYQKYREKLDFRYTGPWPPYNFVKILLKLKGIGVVKR
ncbi:GvpL/GvpF family gas vesicle protein [Calderihabitans maritimus]|nr:GvpL/GvpF family gas vesicle protein [Calderihabitans maritimus]